MVEAVLSQPDFPLDNSIKTLGWGVALWMETYLLQPDGEHAGEAFTLTREQLNFLLWFYAIDDSERYAYRRATLRRAKGWGKSPLLAAISLAELAGPVILDYIDDTGHAVGKQHPMPWVVVAGIALVQTENTMAAIRAMAAGARFYDTYGLDENSIGKTRIILPSGAKIVPITASSRAQEGARPTFAIMDEALALDTPIPTPNGPVAMGDLQAGDVIFGSDGAPTKVTAAHPVQHGRDVYRVTLPNGQHVDASDGHLWLTRRTGSAAKPRIRTTAEMAALPAVSIPRSGPIQTPDVEVPLDPYLFGYWLGDGSTGTCNLTVGSDDVAAVTQTFAARGIELHCVGTGKSAARLSFSDKVGFGADMGGPFARALRRSPAFRDKHIPEAWFQAGTTQRLDLLRGLMDSDGHTNGQSAQFVGTERLTADVMRLASSLGFLPSRTFQADSRSRVGGYYKVYFLLEGDLNPFLLPRKAEKFPIRPRRGWVRVSITAIDSVPVRCISVAAPDRLFQAGNGLVTHNTHHWTASNGGHGLAEVIRRNLAKTNSRAIETTNAHAPGEDSTAEKSYLAYLAQQEGKTLDEAILYDSRQAPDGTDLSDPDKVREGLIAAYGDATWVDIDRILAEIYDPNTSPEESRRFYLNQIIAAADSWVAPHELDANYQPDIRPLEFGPADQHRGWKRGDTVTLGFDGSLTDDSTALVATRVDDGAAFVLAVWEKPEGPAGRNWEVPKDTVRGVVDNVFATLDVVAFFSDVAYWETDIDAWRDAYAERLVVKSTARHAIGWDMRGHLMETTRAVEALNRAIVEKEMPWGPHTLLNDPSVRADEVFKRHLLNGRRRLNRWGVSFGKESRESPKKVDILAALTLSRMARSRLLAEGKFRRRSSGRVYGF